LILLPLSLILSRKGRGEKEEQGERGKRRAKGEQRERESKGRGREMEYSTAPFSFLPLYFS
jgi:hypothetical protein